MKKSVKNSSRLRMQESVKLAQNATRRIHRDVSHKEMNTPAKSHRCAINKSTSYIPKNEASSTNVSNIRELGTRLRHYNSVTFEQFPQADVTTSSTLSSETTAGVREAPFPSPSISARPQEQSLHARLFVAQPPPSCVLAN